MCMYVVSMKINPPGYSIVTPETLLLQMHRVGVRVLGQLAD
jgi:hypothetical protein